MMAKKKASRRKGVDDADEGNLDFETSLSEVEQIVARLEGGELGLTESLEQYEEGIKCLKQCHALLDAAEQRVSLLSGFDADGNPVTRDLGDSEHVGASTTKSQQERAEDDAPRRASRGRASIDDPPALF